MSGHMRHLVIDRLLTEKGVVTFQELQNVLRVSSPTIKRDIRYMREELKAPITYSRSKGGYVYETPGHGGTESKRVFALRKKGWFSAQELYVLVKTIDLLEQLSKDETSAIIKEIEPLRSRVTSLLGLNGVAPKELLGRVKVLDYSAVHEEPASFLTVGVAICEHKRLHIAYHNRTRKLDTYREISPLRLVHYRNHWYLDAYCHVSNDFRTFTVENIRRCVVLPRAAKRVSLRDVEAQLDQSYGIFRSGEPKVANLVFDDEATPYIRREVWHPNQKLVTMSGGAVRLTVPYTNPTELIGEIMKWGPHVEVEGPEELRREVQEHLQKTLGLYATQKP